MKVKELIERLKLEDEWNDGIDIDMQELQAINKKMPRIGVDKVKDFLNNELKINDEVIYIKNIRTGSSTVRNVLFKGKIIGFTPKSVRILSQYTNEYFCVGNEDLVQPTHVCKLNIYREEGNLVER